MNTKFRNIEPFYGFLRTSFSSRLFHQIVGFPLGGGEGEGRFYEIIAYQELFCGVTLTAR